MESCQNICHPRIGKCIESVHKQNIWYDGAKLLGSFTTTFSDVITTNTRTLYNSSYVEGSEAAGEGVRVSADALKVQTDVQKNKIYCLTARV